MQYWIFKVGNSNDICIYNEIVNKNRSFSPTGVLPTRREDFFFLEPNPPVEERIPIKVIMVIIEVIMVIIKVIMVIIKRRN